MKIKGKKLIVYEVDSNYRNYLRKFDSKVSLKNSRRFYGILVNENEIDYCIPLTCKVKSRNSKLTVNIKHKNKVIAQLLLNNMIPVSCDNVNIVDINNDRDRDYLIKEISYLRLSKVINEIISKTTNLLKVNKDSKHKDYEFFKSISCDFEMLEEKCINYNKLNDE